MRWFIYYRDREYAREQGDPLLGVETVERSPDAGVGLRRYTDTRSVELLTRLMDLWPGGALPRQAMKATHDQIYSTGADVAAAIRERIRAYRAEPDEAGSLSVLVLDELIDRLERDGLGG